MNDKLLKQLVENDTKLTTGQAELRASLLKNDIKITAGLAQLASDIAGLKADNTKVWVLFEELDSKFYRLAEVMSTLATKDDLNQTNQRLARVESDVSIIKSVVTDTNHDLQLLERRTTKLETRFA
jgi:hypothetical protein